MRFSTLLTTAISILWTSTLSTARETPNERIRWDHDAGIHFPPNTPDHLVFPDAYVALQRGNAEVYAVLGIPHDGHEKGFIVRMTNDAKSRMLAELKGKAKIAFSSMEGQWEGDFCPAVVCGDKTDY